MSILMKNFPISDKNCLMRQNFEKIVQFLENIVQIAKFFCQIWFEC